MKSHSKSKATIERDKQAKIRLAARNKRTDQQQLDLLIARGAGDCKEAVRIKRYLFDKAHPDSPVTEGQRQPRKSRPARKRRKVPASLM